MIISSRLRPTVGGPVEGVSVVLSDGRPWLLPFPDPKRNEPEYEALLACACEAEDLAEGLRAELALTIFLLDRSYDLSPDELSALLSFEPGDPALSRLQMAVHGLVIESARRSRAANSDRAMKGASSRPNRLQARLRGAERFRMSTLFRFFF